MHRIGYGHRVKQRGSLRGASRPLRVQHKQRIGQGSPSLENLRSLQFLKLDLSGIQRHKVKRNAGAKNFLRRLDVAKNIPLGIRSVRLAVIELTVPAIYGSSHDHYPFQLAESRG